MNQKEHRKRPEHPHTKASRFSKMSFWWLRSLYKLGLTKTITEEDVYETLKDHDSEQIANKFTVLWENELGKKNPSVLRLFYNAYGFGVLSVGLTFSIVETLNRCAQPLFLGALLSYFVDPEITKNHAYMYAAGIVTCSLIPVLTFHPFIYYIMEHGMKIRIGSSRLVYDKVSKTKYVSNCVILNNLQFFF